MKNWIRLLVTLIFGGVFVYAGILKVMQPSVFLMDIRSFALLPDPFAAWLALALPWFEIFAGLAVITGLLRSGGLLALNGLLILFLAVLVLSWARGLDISCGCFGGEAKVADYLTLIVRDLVLLAMGMGLALVYSPPEGAPQPSS